MNPNTLNLLRLPNSADFKINSQKASSSNSVGLISAIKKPNSGTTNSGTTPGSSLYRRVTHFNTSDAVDIEVLDNRMQINSASASANKENNKNFQNTQSYGIRKKTILLTEEEEEENNFENQLPTYSSTSTPYSSAQKKISDEDNRDEVDEEEEDEEEDTDDDVDAAKKSTNHSSTLSFGVDPVNRVATTKKQQLRDLKFGEVMKTIILNKFIKSIVIQHTKTLEKNKKIPLAEIHFYDMSKVL